MMAPRALLFSSVSPTKPFREKESQQNPTTSMTFFTAQDVSGLEHTSPVVIPPKRGPRITSMSNNPTISAPKTPKNKAISPRSSSSTLRDRPVPTSIASILEATAIPVPRRSWAVRESRRLPRGDHVQDFSRLLMEGIKPRDDHLLEGTGNTVLDILLSPPDENEKSGICSDYEEAPSFSGRSMSIESMPSLDHDLDSPSSLPVPPTPASQRSPSERKYRRPSHPEDCALDHPLLDRDLPESDWGSAGPQPLFLEKANPPKSQSPSRSFPRLGSTFKSNLTASLRAIKSAAQTVSTFATPSVQRDDFITRSLFTITPEMTDDRRPPPMNEPPSPALRRYLNPIQVSPAEMYAYQDHPHDTLDSRNCPVSIQMQTYRRSGGRGGGRKGRFHLAGSASRDRRLLFPFNPESPTFSRPREPRENSDFLRMVVLEMNMRRNGKLRDDMPTRARIWLPPRKNPQHRFVNYDYDDNEDDTEHLIPPRWVGISA